MFNAPNAWGLHDMHGNVWEWCEDEWNDTLTSQLSRAESRKAGKRDDARCQVVRGGAWVNQPSGLRAANREWSIAEHRLNTVGFRVARTVKV